jgi:hypothetical protein
VSRSICDKWSFDLLSSLRKVSGDSSGIRIRVGSGSDPYVVPSPRKSELAPFRPNTPYYC